METSNEFVTSKEVVEQATGCHGVGGYVEFAQGLGYTHIEVLNWTSSAGDWTFLVSKDGREWHVLWQENNYPRQGFSREIDDSVAFYGNAEAALELAYEWFDC